MLYICDHANMKHCPGNRHCPKAIPHDCQETWCEEDDCRPVCPCCGAPGGQPYIGVRCIPVNKALETMHACETCGQPTGRTCPCGCEGE